MLKAEQDQVNEIFDRYKALTKASRTSPTNHGALKKWIEINDIFNKTLTDIELVIFNDAVNCRSVRSIAKERKTSRPFTEKIIKKCAALTERLLNEIKE